MNEPGNTEVFQFESFVLSSGSQTGRLWSEINRKTHTMIFVAEMIKNFFFSSYLPPSLEEVSSLTSSVLFNYQNKNHLNCSAHNSLTCEEGPQAKNEN